MMPAEYAAIGQPQGPQPFTVEDLVSIATLVGGIFGNGGGQQLSNAVLYENMKSAFGSEHFTVAGSPELNSQPAKKKKKKPKKHKGKGKGKAKGKPKKPARRRRWHRRRSAGAPDRPARAPARRARRRQDLERPLGLRHVPQLRRPVRPRGADHRPRQVVPLPDPPEAEQGGPEDARAPDAGSVQYVNPVVAGAVPAGEAGQATTGSKSRPSSVTGLAGAASAGLLGFPRSMSNALLVSAADSASGHPLAVMGPQVSYFSPQILMEEDIHGPGIDAEGAAFPGVNLYVELGHGPDYAWSATSAGQNIIDTFAAPLCNPSGGTVSMDSDYYVLNGQCVQMETLTRTESWQPNLGDSTPAGSVTFQTKRTAYGIVIARARIKGQPVVYTNLRSTYMHELDSALGFEQFNEPAEMRNPQDFMNAAYNIGYTFNWFYTDNKNIAYFNSGLNPVRAANTDPLFPSWASDAWKGFHPAAQMTPASVTEQQTPESAHPQAVNQPYLTSWNNKQAPGYNDAATGQEYASVYRSQLLDNNVNSELAASGNKMTLADLINAMATAGTQDLRGVEVLPYALQIIGHPSDPTLATAVDELQAWVASGAHRINRERVRGRQSRGLRPDRRGADHGRVVAAAGRRRVRSDARLEPAGPGRERLPDQRRARPRRLGRPPRVRVRRRVLRNRPEGPAVGLGRQGRRRAESRVLRRRLARQVPRGARELAAPSGAGVARPGVPRGQRLLRRRPDVLGLDPVPADRRDQPAADRMGQPPDVPAGRRDRGPSALIRAPLARPSPNWR